MSRSARTITKTLAAAVAAVLVAVSCPNPIDKDLLLVVADEIEPTLTITAPTPNSYYHGTMHVSGFLGDSSNEAGDGLGRVHTLSFSVSDYAPLDSIVTFEADGSATVTQGTLDFVWDPSTGSFGFDFPSTDLQGYRILTFVVTDVNGNETRRDVGLLPYPYGPHIVLDHPVDLSTYDTEVYIDGTVTNSASDGATDEIRALRWEATGETTTDLVIGSGTLQPDGTYLFDGFSFDPITGAFSDWFDSSDSSYPLIVVRVSALNASGAWSFVSVQLVFNSTGPEITLDSYPTEYSSEVTTAITVEGTVDMTDLKPGSMRYYAIQPSGHPQTDTITPDGSGAFTFTFNPSGGSPQLSGNLTVEVRASDNRVPPVISTVSFTCYDDTDPPDAPTVTGPASPTNDATPTWTWNTPPDTAEFRYVLDDANPHEGDWTPWSGTSWTAPPLSEGDHTLSVQGRDPLYNWSDSGSWTVTIDLTPPLAPVVTGPAETQDHRPTWSWNVPADTVQFRYCLNPDLLADPSTWSWTYTADQSTTSWTPVSDLPHGTHTLYVEARDSPGNWSPYGSHTIEIKEE